MSLDETRASLTWEAVDGLRDPRGESYAIPGAALAFLGQVTEAHVATILPGAVRGNHAHPSHCETLVVLSRDSWRLVWESSDGERRREEFDDAGAVLVCIGEGVPHAVRNMGNEPLVIVSLSNRHGRDPAAAVRHLLE